VVVVVASARRQAHLLGLHVEDRFLRECLHAALAVLLREALIELEQSAPSRTISEARGRGGEWWRGTFRQECVTRACVRVRVCVCVCACVCVCV
jgi:hypothetical protein